MKRKAFVHSSADGKQNHESGNLPERQVFLYLTCFL